MLCENSRHKRPSITVVPIEISRLTRLTYTTSALEIPSRSSQNICRAYDQTLPGMYLVKLLAFTAATLWRKLILPRESELTALYQARVASSIAPAKAKAEATRKAGASRNS